MEENETSLEETAKIIDKQRKEVEHNKFIYF